MWGRKGERTTVDIQNERERQTYYGAMDLYSGEFVLRPFAAGNGDNTVSFIKPLQHLHEGSQILLIWDGASYHRCSAMRAYLQEVNQGLEEKNWKVTCIAFAPNAPDQNPVEDVWLKGKNYLRQHFYENKTFEQVKDCFVNFLDNRVFNFNKMKWYI